MYELPSIVGDQRFSVLLLGRCNLPSATLHDLSGGGKYEPSTFRSGLIQRVERAWLKPVDELSCTEIRVLTTQKMGLRWLAKAIATFVVNFPRVECDLYPGDITLNALYAFEELLAVAPYEAREMVAQDYDWFAEDYGYDPTGFLADATASLQKARALAGK